MAVSMIKKVVRFDTLTITMDCSTLESADNMYIGTRILTDAEKNGASFLVPLYARKSGRGTVAVIAVENGAVRLTYVKSVTDVNCGILRIYT